MPESTYSAPAAPVPAEPTRRWNYRSCPSTGCEWIHNLLPNDRCWNCHKLPARPSDEPDVIGAERGEVTVIHIHLRESLAEAERRLAAAEKRAKDAEAGKEALGVAYCAADRRNEALARQLETARLAIRSSLPLLREPVNPMSVGTAVQCFKTALAAIAVPPATPTGCDPTDVNVCHRCHQLANACKCDSPESSANPVPKVLHCPKCKMQHIDVDDDTGNWATTRHHRKHLCKPEDGGCGNVWQPFDYATVGVRYAPPCPDCSQDAGGVAKVCAKHDPLYRSMVADGIVANVVTEPPFRFDYTNHRGEISTRAVIPQRVWFGETKWHLDPQWVLDAIDVASGEVRSFAMRNMRPSAQKASAQPDSTEPFSAEGAREYADRVVGGPRIKATLRRYADMMERCEPVCLAPNCNQPYWKDYTGHRIAYGHPFVEQNQRGSEGGGE